ncbi:hypothetical protein QFZ22_000101 [Streptomyces canus]|uniref:Uncharacterized protein n=1 Tax=Streptomyces canus TaxID=58343 RepID=A0AAW8F230_9ACTN|nr:hypothetical protein [Streptomyces canus]MDQ0904116.1 hypothetical protein [Streptomyces canus]
MSVMAAPDAAMDHSLGALLGNAVGEVAMLPGQRKVLQSVPASGQVGDEGWDDPLRLGRKMRLRLLAAVQALLADPSIAGLKDAPKLAAVVLYAKSRAPKGEKSDNQTSIWGAELGRWLGMKESTVHHKVLPALRGTDALHTQVVRDAQGHPTGLNCLVMPLWNARKSGGAAHPLALDKAELATLLHLIEALFGPGWTPEDKEPTPPGLLAGRTGKGAATDRLGLLLMVLNTPTSGWLQLCGGSVKKKEGRGAATLARLLGCSPSGARKVLARLTEAGVVARQHRDTATRMRGRGRVRLLPVARAYGRTVASVEAVQSSEIVFSARPDGACGDHAPVEVAGALGTSGIGGAEGGESAGDQERPDGAEFHAVHASGVIPVVPLQLSCGFSGEGRGGEGRRPERVCVREDQAVEGETGVAGSASPVAEGGPLRGEKPKESPVDERGGQRAAGAVAGGRLKAVGGGKAQQQRMVALPADLGLRVALGPVSGLWERLSGWQQDQVEAATKAELARLEGLLALPGGAPRLLADRLTDRLKETGGEALVDRPYPWLIRRGLVQRKACTDRRCDDGIRLDTGGECENCNNVLHIRRARRAKIVAQIDRELPGLSEGERRRVLEERLREQAAIEAEGLARRREQARAERARRDAARAAAQERAKREREAAAAAEAVRQALPCEDCGQDQAAGLCEACDHRRQTETLIGEACLLAAAWSADLTDPGTVAAVVAEVRTAIGNSIATAWQEFLQITDVAMLEANPQAAEDAYAFAAFQTAQQAVQEYQDNALAMLGRTEEAEAEARRAYKAERGAPLVPAQPDRRGRHRRRDEGRRHGPGARRRVPADGAAGAAAQAAGGGPHRDGRARSVDGPAHQARRAFAGRRYGRGGDGVSTELSGVDLARQALVAAQEAAKKNGAPRKEKPKRRTGTALRRDGREPLGLGAAIGMMMAERGMVAPAADGTVLAQFDDILAAAAPELAGTSRPWASTRTPAAWRYPRRPRHETALDRTDDRGRQREGARRKCPRPARPGARAREGPPRHGGRRAAPEPHRPAQRRRRDPRGRHRATTARGTRLTRSRTGRCPAAGTHREPRQHERRHQPGIPLALPRAPGRPTVSPGSPVRAPERGRGPDRRGPRRSYPAATPRPARPRRRGRPRLPRQDHHPAPQRGRRGLEPIRPRRPHTVTRRLDSAGHSRQLKRATEWQVRARPDLPPPHEAVGVCSWLP